MALSVEKRNPDLTPVRRDGRVRTSHYLRTDVSRHKVDGEWVVLGCLSTATDPSSPPRFRVVLQVRPTDVSVSEVTGECWCRSAYYPGRCTDGLGTGVSLRETPRPFWFTCVW